MAIQIGNESVAALHIGGDKVEKIVLNGETVYESEPAYLKVLKTVTTLTAALVEELGLASLQDVFIPDNVETIDAGALSGCNFRTLSVPCTINRNCKNMSVENAQTVKVRPTQTSTQLLSYATQSNRIWNSIFGSNIGEVILEPGITAIGPYAFANKIGTTRPAVGISISAVTIPNTVETIGIYAFHDCSELTAVSIPDSVESIGLNAFYSCDKLETLALGSGVTTVGNNAFSYCTALTDVTLGNDFNCALSLSAGDYTAATMAAMLAALKDLTGQYAKTLTLGAANLAKLSAEQQAIATAKNWNLA
ncbi:MAG: leucine-rich repeat protein [Clostridia bacterium]|nr:leucine-rich repeat protein [Clostridia bacterium]